MAVSECEAQALRIKLRGYWEAGEGSGGRKRGGERAMDLGEEVEGGKEIETERRKTHESWNLIHCTLEPSSWTRMSSLFHSLRDYRRG